MRHTHPDHRDDSDVRAPNPRSGRGKRFSGWQVLLLIGTMIAPPTWATTLQVAVDTTALSGTAAYLAFDFIDGDGVANTATVGNFYTDGTLGAASTTGGASGTLPPGPVTLSDTDFFNEFLQELTLGTTVSFTLDLTEIGPAAGGSLPDSFTFFLLDRPTDPDQIPMPLFATTDPTGAGALFQADIDGTAGGVLSVFAPVASLPGEPDPTVSWTVTPARSVPLPSTAWLLGAGVLGGLAARRRRLTPLSRRERGRG
ncbi:MAG: NF038129 family PEP-CTERM protein [Candidatus Competibacter sp.]|nr:NF038129 family PEP-CTERM protein [Candidatus Competibacter sp.]